MNTSGYPRPYPLHAFYGSVRDALLEVLKNMQAPDALVAGSGLTAMSIACQGDVDVELPFGQVCPVSLDTITIADSGERKTATDSIVCAPIYAYDEKLADEHIKATSAFQVDFRFWEAVDKSLQRKIMKAINLGEDVEHFRDDLASHSKKAPIKPVRNRIVHSNITERPLVEALQGDGKSIAILSDEGETILKGGAMNRLGTLNKAWDGAKVLTLDRADDSVVVTNPRLTISMMVQEKVFLDFMKKRGEIARASGHLARYLVGWPISTQGFRFASLQELAWEHLPKFHQRITELLEATAVRRSVGDHSRKVLKFSQEAKELWVQTQNTIEPRLHPNGDLAGVRDFASKSMQITGRVAAILHHFSGQEGNEISMESLQRALDIVGWHFDEFIRLFGYRQQEPQHVRDTRVLRLYLHSHCWLHGICMVPRNDVRKSGPIRHQGRFEVALNQLMWDQSITIPAEGRRKRYIHLNPAVFGCVQPQ